MAILFKNNANYINDENENVSLRQRFLKLLLVLEIIFI